MKLDKYVTAGDFSSLRTGQNGILVGEISAQGGNFVIKSQTGNSVILNGDSERLNEFTGNIGILTFRFVKMV